MFETCDFTEVLLRIVVGFKKSFVTSLRFFAPSILGTSSLRADVAASVGDNFFCVNLKVWFRYLPSLFRPSLLGTSSLRADVAASVGDNFFA